jgi:hypothetical protein
LLGRYKGVRGAAGSLRRSGCTAGHGVRLKVSRGDVSICNVSQAALSALAEGLM